MKWRIHWIVYVWVNIVSKEGLYNFVLSIYWIKFFYIVNFFQQYESSEKVQTHQSNWLTAQWT